MVRVNTGRLFVLGVLDMGPMHGHRIRRIVELANVQEWGEVRPGALYGMLHRLEQEGLIEAVRSEQAGNRPPRTVYAITGEGRLELHQQREAALTDSTLGAAAIDVALAFAPGTDAGELAELVSIRRKRLELLRHEIEAHRRRDEQFEHFPTSGSLGFRHWELRLDAELRWHDELEAAIPQLVAERRERAWPPSDPADESIVELAPARRARARSRGRT